MLSDQVHAQVERILDVHIHGPKQQRVCTTGLLSLDAKTGGWMPGQTYVIAGKTGSGKTSFATQGAIMLAMDAEFFGMPPVLFFSLEMTQKDMANRVIAWITETPQKLVQRAEWQQLLTDEQAEKVSGALRFTNQKIVTVCTTDASIGQIREHARRFHAKKGLSAVVCDYIGLIEPEDGHRNGTREREVATASRGLKAMAIELDIPVIVLCQLGRAAEKAQEPYNGLLRESGSIENDASEVMFLWKAKNVAQDRVRIILGKSRFSASGEETEVQFNGATGRFKDLEVPDDPSPANDWSDVK
jgi:replicative DNA helicase